MIISLSNFELKILGLNLVNWGWDFLMIGLWPACLKVLIMVALKLFTFAMLLMIISLSDFELKILGQNLVN